jgi:hypothetical protein
VLYQIHKRELDDLVSELQRAISTQLAPLSQRNDRYAETQTTDLQAVVDVWYQWAQELFCDAVGLAIGGPAFLLAFSTYMHQFEMGDFYIPADELRRKTHPITWIRVRLLTKRALAWGYEEVAEKVQRLWNETRCAVGACEDYHGYFEDGFDELAAKAVEDMLIEAAPRRCTPAEAAGDRVDADHSWPAFLNAAWLRYGALPEQYLAWEQDTCGHLLGVGDPNSSL